MFAKLKASAKKVGRGTGTPGGKGPKPSPTVTRTVNPPETPARSYTIPTPDADLARTNPTRTRRSDVGDLSSPRPPRTVGEEIKYAVDDRDNWRPPPDPLDTPVRMPKIFEKPTPYHDMNVGEQGAFSRLTPGTRETAKRRHILRDEATKARIAENLAQLSRGYPKPPTSAQRGGSMAQNMASAANSSGRGVRVYSAADARRFMRKNAGRMNKFYRQTIKKHPKKATAALVASALAIWGATEMSKDDSADTIDPAATGTPDDELENSILNETEDVPNYKLDFGDEKFDEYTPPVEKSSKIGDAAERVRAVGFGFVDPVGLSPLNKDNPDAAIHASPSKKKGIGSILLNSLGVPFLSPDDTESTSAEPTPSPDMSDSDFDRIMNEQLADAPNVPEGTLRGSVLRSRGARLQFGENDMIMAKSSPLYPNMEPDAAELEYRSTVSRIPFLTGDNLSEKANDLRASVLRTAISNHPEIQFADAFHPNQAYDPVTDPRYTLSAAAKRQAAIQTTRAWNNHYRVPMPRASVRDSENMIPFNYDTTYTMAVPGGVDVFTQTDDRIFRTDQPIAPTKLPVADQVVGVGFDEHTGSRMLQPTMAPEKTADGMAKESKSDTSSSPEMNGPPSSVDTARPSPVRRTRDDFNSANALNTTLMPSASKKPKPTGDAPTPIRT